MPQAASFQGDAGGSPTQKMSARAKPIALPNRPKQQPTPSARAPPIRLEPTGRADPEASDAPALAAQHGRDSGGCISAFASFGE